MVTKKKRHSSFHSETKKCRPSQKQLKLLCQKHANTFNQFEKEYEKSFQNNLKQHHQNVEQELIKLFKTPFTPGKIQAKDDFYTYINYQWLSDTEEKIKNENKYYVQVDSFRVTQEKVYYELIDIIEDYIKKHKKSRKVNAIQCVYKSLCDLDPKGIHDYINYYKLATQQRIASNNIYEILGNLNKNEIVSWGCPLVWSVMRDQKNVQYYRSYISAPQLTAYDYQLYITDDYDNNESGNYKRLYKRNYLNYVSRMLDACLGSGHGLKASDVWDCEMDILTALGCNSIKNDSLEGYNVTTHEKALKLCGLDWHELTRIIGYKSPPKTFICSSLNYTKCILETLLKDNAWQTDKWKTYYYYMAFRQVIRFHKSWREIHFDFHEKFVKGQAIPMPKEIYPVFGMSMCFNTFLTNEYIERNKKPQYIDYVMNMATDLLTVYKRIIKRNTWLSPSTKRYALLKLENIHLQIGSPKLLREDPILDYNSKEPYQNLKKIAYWRTRKFIELDSKKSEVDIPVIDWAEFKMVGKQSYIVNAFYTPTENSIYVPLAYLQKPFIDLDERGIEYNLAHIGYTLGHEMSHCLDDMGSKYDYKGNLHNWWTKSDRRKFNMKVKDVIAQYETFAGYDGIDMDASLSTGENLADISGMAICEEYLKDFQDKNKDIVPIRALSFHAFFVYLAIQARQKIFNKAIKAQLKTNPHPMDKYRTNCPLSRLELFRSLYNIKKGDRMYWKSMDTIW
jgi:putative endopeptidase